MASAPKLLPVRPMAARAALEAAEASGDTVLLAVGASMELGDLGRIARATDLFPQIAWLDADGRRGWLALGEADSVTASDREGAIQAPDRCRERLAKVHLSGIGLGHELRYFGGIAFDPDGPAHPAFPEGLPARFVLPEWLLGQSFEEPHRAFVTAVLPVNPGDTMESIERRLCDRFDALQAWREHGERQERRAPLGRRRAMPAEDTAWKRAVQEATSDPETPKVVLARQISVKGLLPMDAWSVYERLEKRGPGGRFCFRFDREAAFLGASPERLLAVEGNAVRADCLAGTVPRGSSPEEDARQGAKLLASEKDAREHAFVVEAVRSALEPLCATLTVAPRPSLLPLPTVQHLHSPVRGVLLAETTLSSLIAGLHPTPAVCGTPRGHALESIRRLEAVPRGWYAGAVGWVGMEGADFLVGIRSAIVREDGALVFGGAGIVAGSEPDLEFEETERKASAMLDILEGR